MAGQDRNLFASEVDFDFLTMIEDGLTATIISKLPTEIKKFKEAMMAEIQALKDLKVYEERDVKKRTCHKRKMGPS